ncbi:MAG: hypothetical protein ABR583_02120 [Gaiellaceae bacterium]
MEKWAEEPELVDVAGVWATGFRTAVTVHELVLDFIREDPFDGRAVVVSRVACSHAVMGALADELARVWHEWVWRSSPPEEA